MAETPLWLSHHRPEHHHRCVHVAGLMVCARCLGLYPLMFTLIALQLALRAGQVHPLDPWLLFLGPVPALFDWARGRLDPATGTNASRLLTGAVLGAALARGLFLHFLRPFNPLSSAQFAFLAAVFALVEALAWIRRRRRTDPKPGSDV